MWATWGGIRESSLKGQQSCDPCDFHLTREKRVRQGVGGGVVRQTGKHKREGDEERRGRRSRNNKNANVLRPGRNDKGIKT